MSDNTSLWNLADALTHFAKIGYDWTNIHIKSEKSANRAQAQGAGFENIVKDILCGIRVENQGSREAIYDEILAFQGSANFPPDAMYRGGNYGDAFEIKKSETRNKGTLDLNSSHPYSHLTSSLKRIASAAIRCEPWERRDLFYVVGNVLPNASAGNWIWLVQGNVFAADIDTYLTLEERIKSQIEEAIRETIMETSETNELGRLKGVDPRLHTDLRIRPMWSITSPIKLFENIPGIQEASGATLVIHTIMQKSKWDSLLSSRKNSTRDYWMNRTAENVQVHEVNLPDPNNLEGSIEAILIRIVNPISVDGMKETI